MTQMIWVKSTKSPINRKYFRPVFFLFASLCKWNCCWVTTPCKVLNLYLWFHLIDSRKKDWKTWNVLFILNYTLIVPANIIFLETEKSWAPYFYLHYLIFSNLCFIRDREYLENFKGKYFIVYLLYTDCTGQNFPSAKPILT